MKSTNKNSKNSTKDRSSLRPELATVAPDERKRRSKSAVGAASPVRSELGTNSVLLNKTEASAEITWSLRYVIDRPNGANDEVVAAQEAGSWSTTADLTSLQTQTTQSIYTMVSATIDYVAALGDNAEAPAPTMVKIGYFRREGVALNERLADFFESARKIVTDLTDTPNQQLQHLTHVTIKQIGSHDIFVAFLKLTPRERAVVKLIVKGLPNKQIAYELGVSIATAKAHVGSILGKLNVSSRARVIALLANVDLAAIIRTSQGANDGAD